MLHLHLRHDFYNQIFKIKHEIYTASGPAPTPVKNCGCASDFRNMIKISVFHFFFSFFLSLTSSNYALQVLRAIVVLDHTQ